MSVADIIDTDKIGLHKYNRRGEFLGVDKLPGGTFIKSIPAAGTVWSAMNSFKNEIANEMYTELITDSRGNLAPSVHFICNFILK